MKKGTKPATKTGEKQQKPARAASVSPAYPTDPFPSLGSLIGRVVEVRPRGEIADAGRVVSLSLSGKVLEWTVMVRDADANWFAIGFSTRHNLGSTDRGDFYWIAARVPGEGPRPALLNGETVLDPELADALRRNRRATLQFGLYLVNGEGREAERTELATDYVDAKVRIR